MKNKFFITLIAIAIAMIAGYNVYQVKTTVTISKLSMANIEALAYELPEVEITCGQSEGRCWFTDKKLVGPLLPWYVSYCNPFSGRQSDYCVPGLPV
ncbi:MULTISPECIES: NVEALA domain-containing protein [Bacteroides]|uniref:NVEALA domain-containing protein n=1 Tax=Bacteroides TaxID=816 RepID=UPI0005A8F47B|nr:NVEALA domain-containing protein [Bacteroides neonati]